MSTEQHPAETETDAVSDADVKAVEYELLRAKNQRLREQFQQAKQTRYRRTVIAFLIIGVVSISGGLLFPAVRALLITLGATGVFGAVLTYLITPEQFHAATVSTRLHETAATNAEAVINELGLQETRMYVPVGDADARLYVPSHENFEVPDDDDLRSLFVATEDDRERGVAFTPCGVALYEDFDLARTPAREPEVVADQLGDAVVEQFELAKAVDSTVDSEAGEARFAVTGSTCGPVSRVDHPTISLLATGLALHLERPVSVEYGENPAEPTVRCVWPVRDSEGET
ncbi:hypothetical protein [Halosegnis longus]|uniref:hypothetical protein n=1 Tax=Halosegnis longus TaxID=2216012 RepID=UPI00096A7AA8|nr:hypothetical protein [Salella cibi]